MPQLEIEKRYLISSDNIEKILRNDFIDFKSETLEQFYLIATIEKTLRYRKEGDRYIKNSKKGNGLVREELEEEVSKSEYKRAKKERIGGIIKKTRYSFTIDQYHFELDIFKGKLKGLRILEVEFKDIEEANNFKMPAILQPLIIKEITNETIYSNGALSRSMQIPLRADAKLSYKKIVESEDKKVPLFDIYISKYENGKFALEYTLKRLLISFQLQIESFIKSESFTNLMLAYKALNRYRHLFKSFKNYIKKEIYLEQLYRVDSLLLFLESAVELEKSFQKLLKCKKKYPLEKQNEVLQTLIHLAQLRKERKEKLLKSNLMEQMQRLKQMKLQTKKKIEKPFEYITYKISKNLKRKIKKLIKEKADATLLYSKLKEYKIFLNFIGKEELQLELYKRLKKMVTYMHYKKIVAKENKLIAKKFPIYCALEKKGLKKLYKSIYKKL